MISQTFHTNSDHNQNYDKILECDWLSPARFEHLKDSVRIMLVIGQCNRTVKGTVNTSYLCKWTECIMSVHCCLAFCRVKSWFFFYENVQPMSNFFLKFCHSFD